MQLKYDSLLKQPKSPKSMTTEARYND